LEFSPSAHPLLNAVLNLTFSLLPITHQQLRFDLRLLALYKYLIDIDIVGGFVVHCMVHVLWAALFLGWNQVRLGVGLTLMLVCICLCPGLQSDDVTARHAIQITLLSAHSVYVKYSVHCRHCCSQAKTVCPVVNRGTLTIRVLRKPQCELSGIRRAGVKSWSYISVAFLKIVDEQLRPEN